MLHIDYQNSSSPCTANRTIQADMWESFSLPCDPGSANTVEDVFTVFAGLEAVDYNVRWAVFSFNAINQSYRRLTLVDRLYPGHGYWVYSKDETTVNYTGVVNMTGDLGLETEATDGKWNFVGFTENTSKAWAEFKAYKGNTLVEMSGITECGSVPPGDQCFVSQTGHVWNGSNYDPYDALAPGFDDDVEPGHAVWVKGYQTGTMLRIEPPAASESMAYSEAASVLQSGSISKTLKDKTPKTAKKDNGEGWFIRLIAESGTMRDRSNVLGQLHNSLDGLDSNDIEELTPFGYRSGGRYLSLTFENDAFTDAGWGYTSDYRAMTKKPAGEWLFLVRASEDAQEITLRWEGNDKLLRGTILRDEQTGKKIPVRPDQSYTFSNAGGENRFTFIVH